jgi:hyaluronan synthase
LTVLTTADRTAPSGALDDSDRDAASFAAAAGIVVIIAAIAWHVGRRYLHLEVGVLTGVYGLMVTTYVLSRFMFAAAYRPPADAGLEPSIAIIVPAFNEGAAVARTIDSCFELDYPASKLEVVVIDDGSSDDTWDHMVAAAAKHPEDAVRCIALGSNQGKRAAMAAGIRETTAEIMVFVDSDSHPAPQAVRRLVQGFAAPDVGAISGLTYVRNSGTNVLTRMQAVRYYVSFQLLKSAESVVGAVACCSGCFAAYRRSAVMEVLAEWEHQRFLGVECTYGDDRALSNMLLRRRWRTLYARNAEAWTDAPDRYQKFFVQQLRWKKSWAREGPLLLAHLWRTRPIAFPFAVVATIASLMSPIVLGYNLFYTPIAGRMTPVVYLLGLYLVSMAYGLLYRALRSDGLWKYAIAATVFYLAFSAQLFWAMVRIRDGSWGTRG